jgi:ribosomal protein L11 methyltransferase
VIRLAVRVARDQAELVLAELSVLAPAGFEERDLGDVVEYAIYGASGELPNLGELRAAVGGALVDVVSTEVGDDWDERWRDWHRPLDVGPLRVRPPWEPPRAGALDVVIDPGQAFGTGAHPSTRLSLALLAELPAGGPLADWGCGSGVLAVAAARLGWAPVTAVEVEGSGDVIAANAARNRVSVEVARLDLRSAPAPWAPTVVANVPRDVLLAAVVDRAPERLLASGFLRAEADDVVAHFGLRERRRLEEGDWAAVVLA